MLNKDADNYLDYYQTELKTQQDVQSKVDGLDISNANVKRAISVTLDDTVVKQNYLGGYIEIQPDSWDGTTVSTDATTKTWGFPVSLLPSERARLKSILLHGEGKNIMYIRLPLGFSYRGYRNIDSTTSLAKNIGERFSGQNASLNSWFDKIAKAGGGLAPEYWCPAPYWVTSGGYSGTNQLRAGGTYSMTTTLASIRTSDATQYSAQISAFTDAIINDLEYLHTNVAPVRMFSLQNEPTYSQEAYGGCAYDAQTYNDVLTALYPKLSASTTLATYNGEANTVKLLVASSDEASPFTGIAGTFITNHASWIWGYTHHSMRKASGEQYVFGADWYKTTEFSTIKGTKTNVFINEYEYFTTDYGSDDFRCSNNMLHLINEAVYGEAQVLHPVIHICKPVGQTLASTNTKGYCLFEVNLSGTYGVDVTSASNTKALNKGCASPNVTMYNSWAMIGDNLPVGAYLVGSYTTQIYRAGWCAYKHNNKLYLFFANNSAEDVSISITFSASKSFNGKMYNTSRCGDAIKSKSGTTIEFVIPAYSGQAWIEQSVITQGVTSTSAILVSDSFNRADSTSLGSADTGQAWSVLSNTTFGISSNHAHVSNNTASGTAYLDAGVVDGTISCDFTYGGYSALTFRITDHNNNYRVRLSANGFGLYKIINAVPTAIASYGYITPVVGTIYKLRVVLSGTSIKCYIDDLLLINATDSTYTTQTLHGVYFSSGTFTDTWDNFLITE